MIYVCEATHEQSDHLYTLENIGLHLFKRGHFSVQVEQMLV